MFTFRSLAVLNFLSIAVLVASLTSCGKTNGNSVPLNSSAGADGSTPTPTPTPAPNTAPTTILLNQDGATSPNNGGTPSVGKFFAQPFRPTSSLVVKFVGIGIYSAGQATKSLAIYSSQGTACDQSDGMGPVDCTPNTSLISVAPQGEQFLTEVNGTTLGPSYTQVDLGSGGIALAADTTYFVVVEFQNNESMSIGDCSNALSHGGRRVSADGATWTAWGGGSNCTHSYRPSFLYLAQ